MVGGEHRCAPHPPFWGQTPRRLLSMLSLCRCVYSVLKSVLRSETDLQGGVVSMQRTPSDAVDRRGHGARAWTRRRLLFRCHPRRSLPGKEDAFFSRTRLCNNTMCYALRVRIQVSENRSAVAREACRCVAVLARCLTDHFGALAELWLPELLRNTTRAVVVAAAGDEAARVIFG